jgi:predicted DNA-binding transcriptional regulator
MSIIRIDEVDYELDLLTEEARAQLISVQHTDQKIAELQRDLAIAQTARASYASALRELLGHGANVAAHPATGLQVRH